MKTPAGLVEAGLGRSIPERGRKLINRSTAVLTGGLAVIGAAAFVEAANSAAESHTRPNDDQIKANTRLVETAKSTDDFMSQMILGKGVKLRTSPNFDNGDNSMGTQSNIALELDGPINVHAAIIGKDGWVAFERPSDDVQQNKTVKNIAEDLVYVNVNSLEQLSPTSISISERPFDNTYIDSNDGSVETFNPATDVPKAQILASESIKPIIE